ncbi:phospholipase A2 precursor-like protein [Euroglyphus maynei]|uniref:Phospholipase A2-like protein n=1 Tax=Euroglyphus maynei TaxID=6958 RepID=A0A1Y3B0V0_EURMA|nr:phospholipase A2 precursor-like protein [Euroglyphus maynei]
MNAFEQMRITGNEGINIYEDLTVDYWDLGRAATVDICCREHDHCPIGLLPHERHYGLRNNGIFPVSLCQCEQLFHDCLERESRSYYGQIIKRIYFGLRLNCLQPIGCPARWVFKNGKWVLRNRDKITKRPCRKRFHKDEQSEDEEKPDDDDDDDGEKRRKRSAKKNQNDKKLQ